MMKWEQRRHSLHRERLVISANRNARPWSGETHDVADSATSSDEDACCFVPGNGRVSGTKNPTDQGVYVLDNALAPLRCPGLLECLAGGEVGGGNFTADTRSGDSAEGLRACNDVLYLEGEA